MPIKINYSINEIENVLELYYKFNNNISKINKETKISVVKIKKIIKIYGTIYEEKYPQYKKSINISTEDFKNFLNKKENIMEKYKPDDVYNSFMEEK